MNSNSNKFAMGMAYTVGVVGVLVLLGLMALYGAWAGAFVGAILWKWFIVETFGVMALTKAQCFGIALLLGFWTFHHRSHYSKDERTWKEHLGEAIGLLIAPWFVLLLGWVCHTYFM